MSKSRPIATRVELGQQALARQDYAGAIDHFDYVIEKTWDQKGQAHICYPVLLDAARAHSALHQHGAALLALSQAEVKLADEKAAPLLAWNAESSLEFKDDRKKIEIFLAWSDALHTTRLTDEAVNELRTFYQAALKNYAGEAALDVNMLGAQNTRYLTHREYTYIRLMCRLAELDFYQGKYVESTTKVNRCNDIARYRARIAGTSDEILLVNIRTLCGLLNHVSQRHQLTIDTLVKNYNVIDWFTKNTVENSVLYKKAIKRLGLAYFKTGKFKEAARDLTKAHQVDATNMTGEDYLCLSQALAKEATAESRQAAIDALAQAATLSPHSLEVRYHALSFDDKPSPEELLDIIVFAHKVDAKPEHDDIIKSCAKQLEKMVKRTAKAWLLQYAYLCGYKKAYQHFSTPRLVDIDTACEKLDEHHGNTLRGIYYLSEEGVEGSSVPNVEKARKCFIAAIAAYAKQKVNDNGCILALEKLETKCFPESDMPGTYVEALYDAFVGADDAKFYYDKALAIYSKKGDDIAKHALQRKRIEELCKQVSVYVRSGESDKLPAIFTELEQHARQHVNVYKVLAPCYDLASRTFLGSADFYHRAREIYLQLADAGQAAVDRLVAARANLLLTVIRDKARAKKDDEVLHQHVSLLAALVKDSPGACLSVIESYELLSIAFPHNEENLFQRAQTAFADHDEALRDLKKRRGMRLLQMGGAARGMVFGDPIAQKKLNVLALQHGSYQAAILLAKEEKDLKTKLGYYQQALTLLQAQVGTDIPYSPVIGGQIKQMLEAVSVAETKFPQEFNRIVLDAVKLLFVHRGDLHLQEMLGKENVKIMLRNAIKAREHDAREKQIYCATLLIGYLPRMIASQQEEMSAHLQQGGASESLLAFHFAQALSLQPQRNALAVKFLDDVCRDTNMPLNVCLAVQIDYYGKMRVMEDAKKLLELMRHQQNVNKVDLQTMMEALPAGNETHFKNWLRAELYAASACEMKETDASKANEYAAQAFHFYADIFKNKDKKTHRDVDAKSLQKLREDFTELAAEYQGQLGEDKTEEKRKEAEAHQAVKTKGDESSADAPPPDYATVAAADSAGGFMSRFAKLLTFAPRPAPAAAPAPAAPAPAPSAPADEPPPGYSKIPV